MQFLGLGVQAKSETRHGHGISRKFLVTVCKPRLGRVLVVVGTQPDFQAFVGNFLGLGMQSMFGPRLGRGRDAVWFPGISRQFLGHGVGHVQDATWTHPNFHALVGSFGTRCAGHVQDVAGTQPDFQAFLGSFWDTVCRPSSECIRVTTGLQPDCQAFLRSHVKDALGPQQGRSLIFRKLWLVSGDGEQAMSGTPPGYVGIQPNFQAFLGSLWTWCVAQVREAS
ncbi:Hypothetical predicted protein [Olea europaea subsp. europaea]|uniref:Uncharacterized protein n=1 Tax=Olea europaea subsp. europaea TaxID=158383 RepID=A0A8S0PNB9_OLEEU|nr:Hypothetical predicted protein [Olea europaea subsp. europaea]